MGASFTPAANAFDAAIRQPGRLDPRARLDEQFILESPAGLPEDEIDAWPQLGIDDLLVRGESCVPLGWIVPRDEVDLCRLLTRPLRPYRGVRPQKAQCERYPRGRRLDRLRARRAGEPRSLRESERHLFRGEVDRVPGPPPVVADPRVELARVRHKGERKRGDGDVTWLAGLCCETPWRLDISSRKDREEKEEQERGCGARVSYDHPTRLRAAPCGVTFRLEHRHSHPVTSWLPRFWGSTTLDPTRGGPKPRPAAAKASRHFGRLSSVIRVTVTD